MVHGSGKVEVCGLKNEKHSVISDLGFSQENHLSKGAFHLSELGGRTMAGPVSFENEIGFFQEFLLKNHFPRACYLTYLAGEFWLKGKLSLPREWSGQSVLTNGKRRKI